jgi:hypothetical protein
MNLVCPNVRHENITFVVVQLAIEIYSLPVSTANDIKLYKHLKTYLIKHKQSMILGECGSQLISVLSNIFQF